MTGFPATFSKAERLRNSSEFRLVLTKGKSIRENGIVLYYVKTPCRAISAPGAVKSSEAVVADGTDTRLGILVSKRTAKRAVDRNKIKRAAREYFRCIKNRLYQNFDIVIRAVSYDKSFGKKELRNILNRLFERAGLVK